MNNVNGPGEEKPSIPPVPPVKSSNIPATTDAETQTISKSDSADKSAWFQTDKAQIKVNLEKKIFSIPDYYAQRTTESIHKYISNLENQATIWKNEFDISGIDMDQIISKHREILINAVNAYKRGDGDLELSQLNEILNDKYITSSEFIIPEDMPLPRYAESVQQLDRIQEQIFNFYDPVPNLNSYQEIMLAYKSLLDKARDEYTRPQTIEAGSFLLDKHKIRSAVYEASIKEFDTAIERSNAKMSLNALRADQLKAYTQQSKKLFNQAFNEGIDLQSLRTFLSTRVEILNLAIDVTEAKDDPAQTSKLISTLINLDSIHMEQENYCLNLLRAYDFKTKFEAAKASAIKQFEINNAHLIDLIKTEDQSSSEALLSIIDNSKLLKYFSNPHNLFSLKTEADYDLDFVISVYDKSLSLALSKEILNQQINHMEKLVKENKLPENVFKTFDLIYQYTDSSAQGMLLSKLDNEEVLYRFSLIDSVLKTAAPVAKKIALSEGGINNIQQIRDFFKPLASDVLYQDADSLSKEVARLNKQKIKACFKKLEQLDGPQQIVLKKHLEKLQEQIGVFYERDNIQHETSFAKHIILQSHTKQVDLIEEFLSTKHSAPAKFVSFITKLDFAFEAINDLQKSSNNNENHLSEKLSKRLFVQLLNKVLSRSVSLDEKLELLSKFTGVQDREPEVKKESLLGLIEEIQLKAQNYFSVNKFNERVPNLDFLRSIKSLEKISSDRFFEDNFMNLEESIKAIELADSSARNDVFQSFEGLKSFIAYLSEPNLINNIHLQGFAKDFKSQHAEKINEFSEYFKITLSSDLNKPEEKEDFLEIKGEMLSLFNEYTKSFVINKLGEDSRFILEVKKAATSYQRTEDAVAYSKALEAILLGVCREIAPELIYSSEDSRDIKLHKYKDEGGKVLVEKTVKKSKGLPTVITTLKGMDASQEKAFRDKGFVLPDLNTLKETEDGKNYKFSFDFIDGVTYAPPTSLYDIGGIDALTKQTIDIIEKLDYMYQQGYVHRDLQSFNLMLAKDGSTKIIDMDSLVKANSPDGSYIERANGKSHVGMLTYSDPSIAYAKDGYHVYSKQSIFYSLALSMIECASSSICMRKMRADENGQLIFKLLGTDKEFGDSDVDHIMISEFLRNHDLDDENKTGSNLDKIRKYISIMRKFIPEPGKNIQAASPEEVINELKNLEQHEVKIENVKTTKNAESNIKAELKSITGAGSGVKVRNIGDINNSSALIQASLMQMKHLKRLHELGYACDSIRPANLKVGEDKKVYLALPKLIKSDDKNIQSKNYYQLALSILSIIAKSTLKDEYYNDASWGPKVQAALQKRLVGHAELLKVLNAMTKLLASKVVDSHMFEEAMKGLS